MKKITMVLVGMLTGTFTFASGIDDPKTQSGMAIVKKDDSSYKLIYKSEEKSDVQVQILDSQNKLVFSEVIKQSDGFSRNYNFEKLSSGEYTIKVDNGSNWLTETIKFRESHEKIAQLVKLGDEKYLLTVPGTGKDNVAISIFDAAGHTVYNSQERVEGNFSRLFDLTSLKGDFSLEVSDRKGISKSFQH